VVKKVDIMLLEFSVENYLCIKNKVTFSFEAMTDLSTDQIYNPESRRLVPETNKTINTVSAIYGANASGKSTLLRALRDLCLLVTESQTYNEESLSSLRPYNPSKPIILACQFVCVNQVYQYGIEIVVENRKIISLQETLQNMQSNVLIIERESQGFKGQFFIDHPEFLNIYAQSVGNNQLILSQSHKYFSEFRRPFSLIDSRIELADVQWWMMGEAFTVLSGSQNSLKLSSAHVALLNTEELKSALLKEIKAADLTIEDYKIDRDELYFFKNDGRRIRFDDESSGTKKYFWLFFDIILRFSIFSKNKNYFYVIDELEKALHPRLALRIINLFKSPATNPHNARLLFTTHDTAFMHHSILNGDQVWLIERDAKTDETRLFSPAEFKDFDPLTLEREYFRGVYGAVPNTQWELK
jgi:uncharacterized protein